MIPQKMLEWLKQADKELNRYKYKTYMRRIQKYIDKNLETAIYLAKNYPEVFLNQVEGISKIDAPKHKRWQDILLLATILRKDYDVIVERVKPDSED